VASTYNIDIWALIHIDAESRTDVQVQVMKDYIHDEPIQQLLGVGYRQSATIEPETGIWLTAHNSYVSLLREAGLLGSFFFGVYLIAAALGLLKADLGNWALALMALLTVAYTEGSLYDAHFVVFLGAIGGLARDTARAEQREQELSSAYQQLKLTC
jgi:O-antigen ligase